MWWLCALAVVPCWEPVLISVTVFLSSFRFFLRILSRNRTQFPIRGTEVGVEVNVSPEMFQARALIHIGSGDSSVHTRLALGAQKHSVQGQHFLLSS